MADASDCVSPAIIEALDWLEYGVLLVNEEARVCFINQRAQQLVQSQELNIHGRQLRAPSSPQTMALHELITRYARQSGEIASPAEANYHRLGRLMLQFAPCRPAFARMGSAKRLVAVFVIDPDRVSDPSPQQLQLQFGLTPAEAQSPAKSPRAKA